MQFLPWPRGLDEHAVLFTHVARRGCHDTSLAYDDFAPLSHSLTHVLLADELGRLLLYDRFRFGLAGSFS